MTLWRAIIFIATDGKEKYVDHVGQITIFCFAVVVGILWGCIIYCRKDLENTFSNSLLHAPNFKKLCR